MAVVAYKEALARIAPTELTQMEAPEWEELNPKITAEVLEDAFTNGLPKVLKMFDAMTIYPRTEKKMERIEIKMKENTPYKVNSDFVAVRVPAQVKQIVPKLALIEKIAVENGGWVHYRNRPEPQADGRFYDVVFFLFVFVPEVGYVVEFQVGHPFSFEAFAQHSGIRNAKTEEEKAGFVDMFRPKDPDTGKGFYTTIVEFIKERAFFELLPPTPHEVAIIWKKFYPEIDFPEALGKRFTNEEY